MYKKYFVSLVVLVFLAAVVSAAAGPAVSVTYPNAKGIYKKSIAGSVDFNFTISDADSNAEDLNFVIAISTSSASRTGDKNILGDANVSQPYGIPSGYTFRCDSNNLAATTTCSASTTSFIGPADANFSGVVADGNYFLKVYVRDLNGEEVFDASDNNFFIDGTKPRLYQTDPTGIFFEYRASVIGEGEEEVEDILRKEYSAELQIDDGVSVCLKALKKVFGEKFNLDRVDAAYISSAEKIFTKYSREEIEAIFNGKKRKKR